MHAQIPASAGSWFRSAAGRRYKIHFAWLIVAKAVLLAALYFIFIAPQTRADTSAEAVRNRIVPAAVAAPAETHQP